MSRPLPRQRDLFSDGTSLEAAGDVPARTPLQRRQMLHWQNLLGAFQGPLFETRAAGHQQGSLFTGTFGPAESDPQQQAASFDPLAFRAQSLQFWRWPEAPQQGAALYLVMDRAPQLSTPLLLYIGETGRADRRWKGEHDCKHYLAAYGEALRQAGLEARCSIRFCCDVPAAVRARRALEQALIRRWQPPFNKETRQRWGTPFTSDRP